MSFPWELSRKSTWTPTAGVCRDWTTGKPEAWWGADERAALWKQSFAWLIGVAAREPSRDAADEPTKVPTRQGGSSQHLPGPWCKIHLITVPVQGEQLCPSFHHVLPCSSTPECSLPTPGKSEELTCPTHSPYCPPLWAARKRELNHGQIFGWQFGMAVLISE